MPSMMQRRAGAAGWYTIAALVPAIALAVTGWLASVLFPISSAGWVVLLLPLPCAALMGFLFGAQPHDAHLRPGRAALRGAGVMLLAFLLCTLVIPLMSSGENEPPLMERIGFVLLVGGFSVGWLALLTGAITGRQPARHSPPALTAPTTLHSEL